ncbi:MAG: NTP transferase domain-containing protein [Oceanospirillaceae bacterium]|nr:NTP transferase domain-containing protein [Oceanospirillaceae bacterium]
MTEFKSPLVVIPARLSSARLPKKLLELVHGKPIIYWTYQAAAKAGVGDVVVAVDSAVIADELNVWRIPNVLTSPDCCNGTERVYEVARIYTSYEFFVNVQGDEPLLNPETVRVLVESGMESGVFKTAISPIADGGNSSEVKVAVSTDNRIRFASRAKIPFSRDSTPNYHKIHGVYMYCRETLQTFVNSKKGPLEEIEQVEQLRCIENDIPLVGVVTPHTERSVDTLADLTYMRSQPLSKFLNENR